MEVTRQNFPSVLKTLDEKIQSSSFIALDLELSGLRTKENFIKTLFDTASSRYKNFREGTVGIVVTQIGLSLFHHHANENMYTSSTYTFHLTPQVIASVNQLCTFEASVFHFLERNNFDFNKFAYEGIPYLNRHEEMTIKNLLSKKALEKQLRCEDIDEYWEIKSKISKWLESASNGDVFKLKMSTVLRLFTANQLKKTYPYLKVSIESNELIIEKQLYTEQKQDLNTESYEQNILNYSTGFSLIVKMLENAKKPLVFHNAYADLLFFYNQFIEPLPASYDCFKTNLNKLFPYIYDNKYIFNKLRPSAKKESVFENTSLENVYKYFKGMNGRCVKINSPGVVFEDGFEATPWFHHAGWDAYCTGFCYIRITHCLACDRIGTDRVLTNTERQTAVKMYCNKVYLSRAAQPFMSLGDTDPAHHRPRNLHIQDLKNNRLNISEVINHLEKYGSIDVKRYGEKTALIAVTGMFSAKRILHDLKHNKNYKVSYFDPLKHSPVIRFALWSSFVLSSSGLLALLFYQLKK